jgi:hypothetical protein
MKRLTAIVAVLALVGITAVVTAAESPFGETGFSRNTTIVEGPSPDGDCPGDLVCNWDGTVENGYCWQFGGSVPPDYGAFADCYPAAFICEGHFYFTQTGYYIGQTVDIYVWDVAAGLPGNVVCQSLGQSSGPVAFWPSCSEHKFVLNCNAPDHFLGYWGNWPGANCGWFICSDEDGFAACPVSKIAPGIGYPTGWGPLSLIPTFAASQSLGICEWIGQPVIATESTTWGQIKALY